MPTENKLNANEVNLNVNLNTVYEISEFSKGYTAVQNAGDIHFLLLVYKHR